jgi:hypothetical protein
MRRATHACAAIGASRSLRDLHAPCSSRDATALPGHGRQGTSAVLHMCVPPSARHRCCETCTTRAARAKRPPSPAMANGGPAPGRTCVCAAIGASSSPRLGVGHAPCSSRDAIAPPRPRLTEGQRGQHMCVPPPARRDRGETCTPRAARATRPPLLWLRQRGPGRRLAEFSSPSGPRPVTGAVTTPPPPSSSSRFRSRLRADPGRLAGLSVFPAHANRFAPRTGLCPGPRASCARYTCLGAWHEAS